MNELEQPLKSSLENSQNQIEVIGESEGEENQITEKESFEKDLKDCNTEGSNLLGKFNDVENLLKAYNNLQAEFTRKCQKLSELEKENQKNKNNEDLLNQNSEIKPVYSKEDFNQNLNTFLTENPNAKQYSKEISLEMINDQSLNLKQAYERVLAKKFREPQELLQDEDFIENFILTNESLKKELLKKYVKEVKESSTPHLISGSSGACGGSTNIEISSLEEANKLALKLFRG